MALHCGVLLTTLQLGPSILSGRKELAKWDEMDIAHCWAMVLQKGVAVELHTTMAMLFFFTFTTCFLQPLPEPTREGLFSVGQ